MSVGGRSALIASCSLKLMTPPVITLLTDFGVSSPYVAQMRGVLLSRGVNLPIIDLTHAIPPQDIRAAALVLDDCLPWFPERSIHLAVVDPGVGTSRRIIAMQIGEHTVLAPDNGLVSWAAEHYGYRHVFAVDNPSYWHPNVSRTFHGRDIFAPVAAAIAQGTPLSSIGTQIDHWQRLDACQIDADSRSISEATCITAQIIYADSFGNLITNVSRSLINNRTITSIECGNNRISRFVETYGDASAGSLVSLYGSSNRLEIAIVNGNAAQHLNCVPPVSIKIHFASAH